MDKIIEVKERLDDYRINEKIIEIDDGFSWKELDCLYRPFAISMKSFNKNYYELFLLIMLYFHIFSNEEYRAVEFNKSHPMFEKYDSCLKDFLGVQIDNVFFETKNEMCYKIAKDICEDKIVILPGDLFALAYSPLYKIEHSSHFFIIKGYDMKREIFYLLDNLHISKGASTCYTDFSVKMDDIYDLTTEYKNKYDKKSRYKYYWTLAVDTDQNGEEVESALRYYAKLLSKSFICQEEEMVKAIEQNKHIDNLNDRLMDINKKNVYYKLLLKVLKKYSDQAFDEKNSKYVDSMMEKIDSVKNKILYAYYKNATDLHEIRNSLLDIKDYEQVNRARIKEYIETHNIEKNMESKFYRIINHNDAMIQIKSEKIVINFDKERIYDSWILTDNACQIVYKVINSKKVEMEMGTVTDIPKSNAVHFGIILLLENGKKVMFGNYMNLGIAVYAPFDDDNKEWIRKEYCSEGKYYIKVSVFENDIKFMIRFDKDAEWKCILNKKDVGNIKEIGLFGKTWENVEGDIEFSDYHLYCDDVEKDMFAKGECL